MCNTGSRWIWHALDVVKPRVVIVEIQELWLWTVKNAFRKHLFASVTQQLQESKTRPYKSDFSADSIPQMGASIAAFNVQAVFRGYRLIGCVSAGFNAIFLRKDIAPDAFPTSVIHLDVCCCLHIPPLRDVLVAVSTPKDAFPTFKALTSKS